MITQLARRVRSASPELDSWYQKRLSAAGGEPPIYSSSDLRNAGFKVSVVDTNLFPAGFNNLCETFSEKASAAIRDFMKRCHPSVRKILIFPEEHTRNLFYWKNVATLQKILQEAGFETVIGSPSTLFSGDPHPIVVDEKQTLSVHKIYMKQKTLRTQSFVPDLILINNDLTTGTPHYLKDIDQLVLPSPHLGWHHRRKSRHFHHYQSLMEEVGPLLDIDPWLLSPLTTVEGEIDLSDEICLNRLKEASDQLLAKIRQKYDQHGITAEPYLFVKNNTGTYGLGITHIKSGKEFLHLNRKTRQKLEASKGGKKVSEYLIQEGIPTADLFQGKPLEPVIYMAGGEPIGSFFRQHAGKNEFENLNTPGMSFNCLCLHLMEDPNCQLKIQETSADLFQVASFLGKIASLALLLEFQEVR